MKRKSLSLLLSAAMCLSLAACGGNTSSTTAATTAQTTAAATPVETTAASTETTAAPAETTVAPTETTVAPTETTVAPTETAAEAATETETSPLIRVGSLKGPTSMGLVHLMDRAEKAETANPYEFTMVTAADELLAKVVSKEVDIALIPANVASVLYNKTNGGISVIDINTLGVLYIVTNNTPLQSFSDLKGKTVYMTGKGTTPDHAMHYLMAAHGLTEEDVRLEYKSEATEVAAILKEQPDAIGLLPQPFATAACIQNENLQIVLELTEEWDATTALLDGNGSQMVTGVTIVRNEFLNEAPDAVAAFLEEHQASAAYTEEQPDESAELVAKLGIIEKAAVAKKALPYCNITCITGAEMQSALSGYLQVLFDQDASAIGGALPADDFYYIP